MTGRPGLVAVLAVTAAVAENRPAPESEARAYFDVSPSAQFLLDPDLRIRAANQAAARLFASKDGSLVGRAFGDLLANSSRSSGTQLFALLATPDAPGHRVAVEGVTAQGLSFPVELVGFRLSASVSGGFGAVLRDLRDPAPTRTPSPIVATEAYTLAELLMANRLRELV